MIKVCQVSTVHKTFDTRIFFKMCVSLAKRYDVYYVSANARTEEVQGVHIRGVELPKSRIKRPLYLGRVFRELLQINAEVYHFHDPELQLIGLKLKKRGKIVIFDSHEDIPSQWLTKEYLPRFMAVIVSKLYSRLEKYTLKKYDALISVNPSIVERLKIINPNTHMVTNYPVYREVEEWKEKSNSICFAGGVLPQYSHECIIDALTQTKAQYKLAGPAYPGYLDELKKRSGWSQVQYLGILSQSEVYQLYKESVAGLALLDYLPNVGGRKGTIGVLKIYEYMMAGIPVIATDFEVNKEIIEDNDCGCCINPHDVKAIADAINFYINNPAMAKRQGENGKRLVREKYNWGTQERILFKLYEDLLNR